MDMVIPIGIYCYFGFDLIEKLRSFRFVRRKASINAISICQKPTQERTFAKRFSQDIFLSSAGFDCKGTIKFADVQEKSHFNAIFLVYGVKCRGKFSLVDAPLALQFKV